MLKLLALLAVSLALAAGEPPGLRSMEHPERIPFLLPNGTQTRQFVSYDPSGSNNDGNFHSAYTKYVDLNGEYVIFDAFGSGCLYRQQYNVWFMGRHREAGKGRIKYYFDNEAKPRIDLPIDEFFGGKVAPFTPPFAFLDPSWRFAVLYYPFPFRTRLKITTTADLTKFEKPYNAAWYQFTYLSYPEPSGVVTWAGPEEDSPAVRSQWEHAGANPKPATGNRSISRTARIPAGGSATLASLEGEGSIAALRLHLEPYSREIFYRTILRIYWDGSSVPAVDLPLGLFFGGGGETYEDCQRIPELSLKTLFYGFDGKAHEFYSYWPMPYWRSARIELRNDSGIPLTAVHCRLDYKPSHAYRYPKGLAGHFHARRTVSRDAGRDLFATAFEETGRGHVAGISFYSSRYAMDGDEFTYIDGSRTPQIHGDGTEDDHNQGWGGGAFQKPLWGGLVNGFQGAYRLYFNDAYVFNRHIRINYEFSREGGNDFGGEADAVIYYYKSPSPPNLVLTDRLDVGEAGSEKAHHYRIGGQTWAGTRSSGYDGYERDYEYDLCRDDGRAFLGHSEFTAAIAPDNDGVKLRRRLYRAGNGLQRATVRVDGVQVRERLWNVCTLSSAPWYQGWFDSDFEIPARYTRGKKFIRVRIENAETGRENNEFHYWVYCYQDRSEMPGPAEVARLRAARAAQGVDLEWAESPIASQTSHYRIYRSLRPDFSNQVLAGTSDAPRFRDSRVKPELTYHYRVAAADVSAREGPPSEPVRITTARDTRSASANAVGSDDTTMGNWPGKYGRDGFLMPKYFFGRDARAWPEYLSAVDYDGFKPRQFSTWNTSTVSSLLTSPISYSARFLGALETATAGSVTIYTNDSRSHQLALYFCDFDKAARRQRVEILSLSDSVLSPGRDIENFANGRWLLYRVSGNFRIHVTNADSAGTAVLSALMFD